MRQRILLSVILIAAVVTAFWIFSIRLVAGWLNFAPGTLLLGSVGAVIFAVTLIVGAALASSGD